MALRSARLEALFGGPVAGLTASSVQSLVTNGVSEAFDLDFKATLYGRGDADKRDLAGDVAALANTAGGVLVLGVDEDDQARASSAPGVDLSDDEERRMRQVIASLVSPVPAFDIHAVPSSPGSGHGFYALAVERTVAAPHAVIVNNALRYPTRNGASTRYLSEPEVAEAYRVRLAGLAAQNARLEELWRAGVRRLNLDEGCWAAIALVPEVRGSQRIDQAAFRAFEHSARAVPPTVVPMGYSTMRTQVGPGYLVADGTNDFVEPLSRYFRMEFHSDGSGFFAVDVAWRRGRRGGPETSDQPVVIDDEHMTIAVISGLLRLASYARDETASSGVASIRAGFHAMDEDRPVLLGHPRGGTWGVYNERPLTRTPVHISTSAELDAIGEAGPELVSVAARICHQLGQGFAVPEVGQLTSQGELRRPYWSHAVRPRLEQWANQSGIEFLDETLP